MIDDQRCGLAEREDSSRNTRIARRFHHGLANRCKPACKRGASRSSAVWEYEMNASNLAPATPWLSATIPSSR